MDYNNAQWKPEIPCKCFTLFFMFILKLKQSQIWFWKWLGEMDIEIPPFWTLWKVSRYKKSSLKRSLGCSRQPNWLSSTTRPGCAEASAQRLGRAPPSVTTALFKVLPECFSLQWCYSYSFKECTYLLKNTFTKTFSLFSKFLGSL